MKRRKRRGINFRQPLADLNGVWKKILAKEREVTFEEIVQKISSGAKGTEMEHP
jgi:hypothetical protein